MQRPMSRVVGDDENDGNRRGCRLGRQRRGDTTGCDDRRDLSVDQFCRQRREPCWRMVAKAALISLGVLGLDVSPSLSAPRRRGDRMIGRREFITLLGGAPPGRLRLGTKPCWTGSPAVVNTTGIVVVAALAANTEAPPPVAAITATLRPTRSAASAGNLSGWPSAKRYSIATLRPSTKPTSLKPRRNASLRFGRSFCPRLVRKPTTGMTGCCAREASGHPAAAPPSSDVNVRRFIAPRCMQDHA
jgi:hypothetical protein